jgi:nucleoside 2-deoxyribosyltransferase
MKVYLAGPLFTASELDFNRRLRDLLEQNGHQVWLPQEQTADFKDAASIFKKLLEGLTACDVVIANMDGADPDSGTSWECGYAYARSKPTIVFRTDTRSRGDTNLGRYNLMLWASATAHLDGPFRTVDEVAFAIGRALDDGMLARHIREHQSGLNIAR